MTKGKRLRDRCSFKLVPFHSDLTEYWCEECRGFHKYLRARKGRAR